MELDSPRRVCDLRHSITVVTAGRGPYCVVVLRDTPRSGLKLAAARPSHWTVSPGCSGVKANWEKKKKKTTKHCGAFQYFYVGLSSTFYATKVKLAEMLGLVQWGKA